MQIKKITNTYDFFDNSKIVTINLPGHTPGSIGLAVSLEKSRFLIASDALSLERNLYREEIPKNTWNGNLLLNSYKEINKIKNSGYKIICGHDSDQWTNDWKFGKFYN